MPLVHATCFLLTKNKRLALVQWYHAVCLLQNFPLPLRPRKLGCVWPTCCAIRRRSVDQVADKKDQNSATNSCRSSLMTRLPVKCTSG
jgi:hypothetical protein